MNTLDIQDLSYQYQPGQPVLKALDLQMKQKGILGLLGINGAGKSTLIGLLTGQLKKQSGDLTVLGLDYATHRTEILRQIALVPQGYAFYPTLTVLENLQFFADLRADLGERTQRVEDAIAFCQLEAHRQQTADRLSGGLKRRLNLAIGLVNRPKLLFLDEPTVGIDPISRDFILKAIRQLRDQGVVIVYTSHHMQEIELLCDQVALLHQGEVRFQGELASWRRESGVKLEVEIDQAWLNLNHLPTFTHFCQQNKINVYENILSGRLPSDTDLALIDRQVMAFLNHLPGAKLQRLSMQPLDMETLFFESVQPDVLVALKHASQSDVAIEDVNHV